MNTLLAMLAVASAVGAAFFVFAGAALAFSLLRDARRLHRRAGRRCARCANRVRCAPLLAARDWAALRTICAVPGHVDSLRAA